MPQNGELLSSNQVMEDLIPVLHQLYQENQLLKSELGKYKKMNEENLTQISEYARMVPQLHSEIERLRKENDELRSEIFQLQSLMKIYGDQISNLMSSKANERKLAIRRLFDYINDDESLKSQLSQKSKEIIKALKTEVNTAAHNYSKEQIREAIRNESRPGCKACFIEMYNLKFGAYTEVNIFDPEMDDILNNLG